jgi:UDP-N-acetyl-D-galactosamine dehydrogenase
MARCDFFIVTVPTPIDEVRRPDLGAMFAASRTVGSVLKRGDIVVYESTVYPGAVEDECVPILTETSGLRAGIDFTVGYSPERINPGDREHRFETILKVVSAQDSKTLDIVAGVYESVVIAGIHRAPSIKVAEAAKVIENTQRDLNIALMNELALIFPKIGIDTTDVLTAAGTKWNFLPFRPGLVGGHCIGVDPYYLTHKAEMVGYHPQVILAGRRINDGMGAFIAQRTIKEMIAAGSGVKGEPVIVFGLTFKEDVPDLRNSKVIDVIHELQSYGVEVHVHDPVADADEAMHEYGVKLVAWDELPKAGAAIAAVAHAALRERGLPAIASRLAPGAVLVDVKSAFDPVAVGQVGLRLWRL